MRTSTSLSAGLRATCCLMNQACHFGQPVTWTSCCALKHWMIPSYFPSVLELFSRRPEIFQDLDLDQITTVAVAEDRVSLSAILLEDQYYDLIQVQRIEQAGLSLLSAPGLIALKAKAWLDLSERKRKGEQVDGADIRKHKNDVFRLFQIVGPAPLPEVPEQIRQDMDVFLSAMETEEVDLRQLGIRMAAKSDVLAGLRVIYCT